MIVDTYVKSTNEADLLDLKTFLKNVMKPTRGSAATDEYIDDEGNTIPAQPAKGDPNYWYTCVRASFAIPVFNGCEACTTEEGQEVVGVWA